MYFCGHLFRPCFPLYIHTYVPILGNSCTNIFDIWKAIYFWIFSTSFCMDYGCWECMVCMVLYGVIWYRMYIFLEGLWMYYVGKREGVTALGK